MTITTKREVTAVWDVNVDANLELSSFVTWNYQVAPLIILVTPLTLANTLQLQVNTAATDATAVWVAQAAYSWDNFIQTKGTASDGLIAAYVTLTGSTSYFLDRYASTSCNPQLRLTWADGGAADPGNVRVTVVSPGTV